ncbi:ankyrin repeat domain-containing protein [Campylobacter sp.]|uniref:ankyrin repeat domain-containing protein n=1 Tax=Campylobacter sp. TaxID=205 RepID=UPI0025C0B5DE|nr:ankyrin repeat domain-containing protein [Campylobacter sp.]
MRFIVILFLVVSGCFGGNITDFQSLEKFIKDGQAKGYFPKKILVTQGFDTTVLEDVSLNFSKTIYWDINSRCNQNADEIIIAESDTRHSIVCPGNNNVYILTGGRSDVEDPWGNDIFVMGENDDKISKSWGTNIFIFGKRWGHDKIEIGDSRINPASNPEYKSEFPYEFSHFFIFDSGVKKDDLVFNFNKIINLKTNDSIELTDLNGINLIFKDEPGKYYGTNSLKEIYDKNFFVTPKTEESLSIDEIQTLLHKTAYSDNAEDAKKYCEMGGDPNFKGHENTTPIEMAVMLGSENSLRAMLECAKRLTDSAMMMSVFGSQHDDEKSFRLVKLLEKYGGNFKAKDRDGCSMVNYAASSHSLEIVKYLIERGADPKARCSHNQSVTPSDWARKNEDKRVYEYLKSLEAK